MDNAILSVQTEIFKEAPGIIRDKLTPIEGVPVVNGMGDVSGECISWFKSSITVMRERHFDVNEFLLSFMKKVQGEILAFGGRMYDFTICAVSCGDYAKVSLDKRKDQIVIKKRIDSQAETVKLVLAVKTSLKYMRAAYMVENVLIGVCGEWGLTVEELKAQLCKNEI